MGRWESLSRFTASWLNIQSFSQMLQNLYKDCSALVSFSRQRRGGPPAALFGCLHEVSVGGNVLNGCSDDRQSDINAAGIRDDTQR